MDKKLEQSLTKTYRREIFSKFMKAITVYDLIQENDCIAICISGGKDSMLLAKCMQTLQRYSKVPFTAKYLVMDPGYNTENLQKIRDNARLLNIPIEIRETNIFDYVKTVQKRACYLCAKMRRGSLYNFAKEMGCNKIALGHHYDDVIETTLMNMFYSGEIATMLPKLKSDNFEGMELIRPFYLVKEDAIIRCKEENELMFLQCACRFTEMVEKESGQKEKTSKRDEMKQLVKHYRSISPVVEQNLFRCMSNINLDKVLGYYDDTHETSFLDKYK